MKAYSIIILLSLFILSCKDSSNLESKIKVNQLASETKVDLVGHPLIFENLNIEITEFSSEEIDSSSFLITIKLKSPDIEKYEKNHFVFIHALDYNDDEKLLNFDTTEGVKDRGEIVFKSIINPVYYDYKEIRFGLVDKVTKNRVFVRKLLNVSIKN